MAVSSLRMKKVTHDIIEELLSELRLEHRVKVNKMKFIELCLDFIKKEHKDSFFELLKKHVKYDEERDLIIVE